MGNLNDLPTEPDLLSANTTSIKKSESIVTIVTNTEAFLAMVQVSWKRIKDVNTEKYVIPVVRSLHIYRETKIWID